MCQSLMLKKTLNVWQTKETANIKDRVKSENGMIRKKSFQCERRLTLTHVCKALGPVVEGFLFGSN